MQRVFFFAIVLLTLFVAPGIVAQTARREQLSDHQIAEIIVGESRQSYYRTGHPCACPEDLARNGSRCGKRSAYSRPGGAQPYCYARDVPTAEIARYRTAH